MLMAIVLLGLLLAGAYSGIQTSVRAMHAGERLIDHRVRAGYRLVGVGERALDLRDRLVDRGVDRAVRADRGGDRGIAVVDRLAQHFAQRRRLGVEADERLRLGLTCVCGDGHARRLEVVDRRAREGARTAGPVVADHRLQRVAGEGDLIRVGGAHIPR